MIVRASGAERRAEIARVMREEALRVGGWPSLRDIGEVLFLDHATVLYHLRAMVRDGSAIAPETPAGPYSLPTLCCATCRRPL